VCTSLIGERPCPRNRPCRVPRSYGSFRCLRIIRLHERKAERHIPVRAINAWELDPDAHPPERQELLKGGHRSAEQHATGRGHSRSTSEMHLDAHDVSCD
jgi:hypothetical protein